MARPGCASSSSHAPLPSWSTSRERSNGHGNARRTEAEASPFRELLTEFRGLTERYGQALLALGEARGEVASLRSRVDVLEARMDLRLPFSSPMKPLLADPPPSSEPTRRASDRRAAPPAEAADHGGWPEPEAAVDVEPDAERSARRKRSRAHFSDEFADALARAEDPSPPCCATRPRPERASPRYITSARKLQPKPKRPTRHSHESSLLRSRWRSRSLNLSLCRSPSRSPRSRVSPSST